MKSFIVLSVCFAIAYAGAPSGPYSFGYATADGQSRQESGVGGAVQGSYSYVDANGDLRQVRYTADANGYRPEGDISVDRRTAAAAEQLAALAPRAPVPVAPAYAAPAYGYAAAPFTSYNTIAAPIAQYAAPYAAIAGPAIIGRAGYQVVTPTHKIWAQI